MVVSLNSRLEINKEEEEVMDTTLAATVVFVARVNPTGVPRS